MPSMFYPPFEAPWAAEGSRTLPTAKSTDRSRTPKPEVNKDQRQKVRKEAVRRGHSSNTPETTDGFARHQNPHAKGLGTGYRKPHVADADEEGNEVRSEAHSDVEATEGQTPPKTPMKEENEVAEDVLTRYYKLVEETLAADREDDKSRTRTKHYPRLHTKGSTPGWVDDSDDVYVDEAIRRQLERKNRNTRRPQAASGDSHVGSSSKSRQTPGKHSTTWPTIDQKYQSTVRSEGSSYNGPMSQTKPVHGNTLGKPNEKGKQKVAGRRGTPFLQPPTVTKRGAGPVGQYLPPVERSKGKSLEDRFTGNTTVSPVRPGERSPGETYTGMPPEKGLISATSKEQEDGVISRLRARQGS